MNWLEKEAIELKKIEDVISLFKENKPKTQKDVKKLGLKLRQIGTGAYRRACQIDDLPLVVKFPKEKNGVADYRSNQFHAKEEIKKINLIKETKKYHIFKRFLPDIHYFNPQTGLILMPKYRILRYPEAHAVSTILGHFIEYIRLPEDGECDIHSGNIGYDDDHDRYVLLDLGFF